MNTKLQARFSVGLARLYCYVSLGYMWVLSTGHGLVAR